MHTTKFFSISILFFRYALCVNKTNGTTALHKISKGKRLTETPVLTTFNYEIRSAAMTVASNSNLGDKSIVLVGCRLIYLTSAGEVLSASAAASAFRVRRVYRGF